jgi:hypothetical protein
MILLLGIIVSHCEAVVLKGISSTLVKELKEEVAIVIFIKGSSVNNQLSEYFLQSLELLKFISLHGEKY